MPALLPPLTAGEPETTPLPALPAPAASLLDLADPSTLWATPDPSVELPHLPSLLVDPSALAVVHERVALPWTLPGSIDGLPVTVLLDPMAATSSVAPASGPAAPRRVRLAHLTLQLVLPPASPGATLRLGRDAMAGRIDVRVDAAPST